MLQNQNPVRRWKQWLVLPALGGLFLAACQATDAPPVAEKASVSRTYPFAKIEDEIRAIKEVRHLDSIRTNGKFEPGTGQLVVSEEAPYKPGLGRQITVTVTRGPVLPPSAPTVVADTAKVALQPTTSSGHKVYNFVEQMPTLPGNGGQRAIVEAIQQKLVYPKAKAGETLPDERVFANFVVDTDGTVQDAVIVKSLSAVFDNAVLASIKQLPRFEPGKQNGKPVAVSFTVPVEFRTER